MNAFEEKMHLETVAKVTGLSRKQIQSLSLEKNLWDTAWSVRTV